MTTHLQNPTRSLTRLRRTPALRALCRETRLAPADLVQPLFVAEDTRAIGPVVLLPGTSRFSLDQLADTAKRIADRGVRGVLVFGLPAEKDADGVNAVNPRGIVPEAVEIIKRAAPALAIITDVCLCQYTTHGHCGLLADNGRFDPGTLDVLGRIASAHAAAGADVVAPSGMLDGAVAAIRAELDARGYDSVAILSYAVKYASALYGPFRDAARSSPTSGDRRAHQMDPANGREALAEAAQDLAEGADAIMVKPAGASLDVIARIRDAKPEAVLAAYQVSGEHAMITAAAERGWIDRRLAVLESLTAIKRAGAQLIVTYSALEAARWLHEPGEEHT